MDHITLSIVFGAFVGFALGLTGGGGSLLAVPLLVYGLGLAPRSAFGVSLAAVGATALVGIIPRLRAGQVEVSTGVLFAVAGMFGAPLGTWAAGMISEAVLLTIFSVLMLLVAFRMWNKSRDQAPDTAQADCETVGCGPSCQRSADGKLKLTSRCATLLTVAGLVTGFLSGMFGVGGGFVIVPALVLFSGMPIHRAVATSLLIIVLVSVSGVASHVVAGRGILLRVTGLFVLGGVIGMSLGGLFGKRLPASVLQKVFATGIVAVATFIISKTLV
jgi:uncharacterized membrane protein YfcA